MQVKIKKPIFWFGPYHFWELFFKKEYWVNRLANKTPELPFKLIHRARLFFNKPKIRIDPWDAWSADVTLSQIILPILYMVRVEKQGVPSHFVDSRDPELFTENVDEAYRGVSRKNWDTALSKMIYSFEHVLQDSQHGDMSNSYWEPYWENRDGAMVINHKKMNEYYAKIQEGFKIFGENITNLWT